ncbi:MAG: N-acetyl sugar amidotransferase, partial [Ignavibacteriae bacterium]|nr:N-acetyl sugar amidotransferase [Ignavibacteriota bacterium]
DLFLDFIGLSEQEFLEIAKSHTVSPYQHDQSKIIDGKKLHDFDKWSKGGKMPREEAEKQLSRWKKMKGDK